MHGSCCSYVPHGFPAMSINMVETGFVSHRTDPTKDNALMPSPGKSLARRRSSNRLMCPQGGFGFLHCWQVVWPTRVSCLYGTPMTTSCRATRAISRQASSKAGIRSNTFAQKTQSNDESGKSSRVASPPTLITHGWLKEGILRSSAVTVSKYPVSSREKNRRSTDIQHRTSAARQQPHEIGGARLLLFAIPVVFHTGHHDPYGRFLFPPYWTIATTFLTGCDEQEGSGSMPRWQAHVTKPRKGCRSGIARVFSAPPKGSI